MEKPTSIPHCIFCGNVGKLIEFTTLTKTFSSSTNKISVFDIEFEDKVNTVAKTNGIMIRYCDFSAAKKCLQQVAADKI